MRRPGTLNDLKAVDDPAHGEFPPRFDYHGGIAQVAALRAPLEALTGFPLVQDTCVQDASFFTELAACDPVPRSHPVAGQVTETYIAIRFSSFGRFFTIWGCSSERPITDDFRACVAAFVSELGFVYVPDDLLDLPHPRYGTWRIRYFDYL